LTDESGGSHISMAARGCRVAQRSLPLWLNEALLHRASAVAIEPDSSTVAY
jgi:hypothetical protein